MSTPTDFSIHIREWAERAGQQIDAFCTEFVQDIAAEIIMRTPVDTGFLRGSWWGSIDSPNVGNGAPDKGGAGAVARINLAAVGFGAGHVFYLMNGAKYAPFVEYGTSRMTPRAFVRGTVARAPAIAEATIARLRQP